MEVHQNEKKKYSIFTFYKYLDRSFITLQIIGVVSATIGGGFFTGSIFILAKIYTEFTASKSNSEIKDDIQDLCWVLLMVAGILGVSCCIFFTCLHLVGQKVSYEFRWRYLKSILTKDTEWFESNILEELPTKVHTNLNEIENSSGKTIGFILYSISACICGIIYGILLGAVFCSCILFLPVIVMMIGGFNMFAVQKANEQEEKNFIRTGADLEQTLNAIKVVKAYGQERYEVNKYERHLVVDKRAKKWYTFLYGLSVGCIETVFYFGLMITFVIGGAFVIGKVNNGNFGREYRIGDCLGMFWCIQYGTYCFGNSFLNIEALQRGLNALQSVMEVIDHVPTINVEDDTLAPINSIDNIEYKNVVFQYKSRNNPAVRGVNINILKGKTTAFVGESGSGKTTIVKLLNRLYDPTEGEVLINRQDLRSINLRQYRRRISYVSQEPSLFNESIKENLLNGNPSASDAEIEEALKVCMAYDFIQKLPQGLNTNFGEIGGILSGGQKQRIALARAVLRKPDLLILDEATSALDMKNEKKVQEAIENVSKQFRMTTVVIAHRLNTIINADMIYVLNQGEVVEKGNHNELINNGQMYAEYYKSQQSAMKAFQTAERNYKDADKNETESEDFKSQHSKDINFEDDVSAFQTSINLFSFTKPKIYVFITLLGAIYVGCSFACLSIPFAKQAFKVIEKDSDHEKWKAIWYCEIMVGSMTIAVLIVQSCTRYFIRRTTDKLSINMRSETFKTLVKQPIQFFDAKANSIGSLVGMLASDIRHLNGNSVEYYILVLQGVSALICGIIIAFCYSWRLCLLMIPILPFLCIGFTIQYQLQFTPPNKSKSNNRRQLNMVSDCIMNYQTIASLAYEDEYLEKFGIKSSADQFNVGLFNSEYITIKNAVLISVIYGLSQAVNPIGYFVGCMSMIERIDSGKSRADNFLAFHANLMGAFVLCNAMMNSPNFAKGKMVAAKILSIIAKPKEGTEASPIKDGSEILTKNNASMDIVFRNVWFKYPLESSKWVLRNFNLTIKGGQKIGLIGESGCGKSTIVQLLLRFYDPQEGEITIGGINIQELTISSLRSMFGLVQQEPVLFNTSIMENVIYGKPDANAQEIVSAAKMANAHDFICTLKDNPDEVDPNADIVEDARYSSLEDGYRSLCGSRGSKLSGGQKQRIAIARALVRDPPILLLDEATSALDEKCQREVQEALDSLTINKTCIIIAHRVSTLKKCDKIYEVAEGTILS